MKIVHYTASLNRTAGGLPYAAAGLALAQRKLGASVEVHGGVDGFGDDDRLIWQDLRLNSTAIPDGTYGLSRAAIKGVLDARPDILHIHGIWCASSIVGRIAAMSGIATVVAPHGMLDPWILQRSRTKKAVHSLLLEKPLIRRSAIHALNLTEANAVRAFMAGEQMPIWTVSNGIDLPQTSPVSGRSGMLYLGRLHEKKQVVELIERWTSTPSLSDIPLTIAGDGAPDYVARVRNLADRSPRVSYLGPVYGKAKDELFARSAWFILPSLSEGLPMAVLEAIGAGCVPVITPECNLDELVERECAIAMNKDFSDFEAVAEVVAQADTMHWEQLSRQARTVAEDFAWAAKAECMLSHYESLLARRST